MTEQIKKCKDCVNYDETKARQCICYNNECEPNEDATHCCEFADRVNHIKSAIKYGTDYYKDLIGACCDISDRHKDYIKNGEQFP